MSAAGGGIGRSGRNASSGDSGRSGRNASSGNGSGRRRGANPVAWAVLVLFLLAGAGAAYVWWALGAPGDDTTPVEFEVPRGSGAARVSNELFDHGLIRDPRVFLGLLRYQGLDRRLGEGLYDLHEAMTAQEVAAALARGGRPRTVRLVVPEGIRLVDVARRLEALGLVPAGAALERMHAPGPLRPAYAGAAETLEGYLFPASYDVPVYDDLDAILSRLLRRFEQELGVETVDRIEANGLDVHAWVTLASMVQAEAANDEEMPIIAGVFLNRLEIGMPLQSDPTVAYGLGKDLPQLDFPGGDFEIDHPWNTYTRDGLPVGPIGNPGRAALEAVLEPETSDELGRPWLYFLHGRDASGPVFRPNLDFESHLRDIERYLRR